MTAYDTWKATNTEDAQYCECGNYMGDCCKDDVGWCPRWDDMPEAADERDDA